MGDRCYMEIECRVQDKAVFEEIGFVEDGDPVIDGVLGMMCEEANYAFSGQMPTNIPWTGESGNGDSYGPSEYACDGKGKIAEVETGQDNAGYVVDFNPTTHEPTPRSVLHVKKFLAMLRCAQAAMEGKGE